MIGGCLEWQASGLQRPAKVSGATEEYFADQDLFGQWLDERCRREAQAWEQPTPLFRSWCDYARDAGESAGNPAQLTLVAGWSARFEAARGQAAGIGLTLNDLYASLLSAQKAATLMEVQTGKRLYHNMLIRSLAIETDQATENALMVTIQLQEVMLVEAKQTTLPPAANRKNPKSNHGVTNTGTKQAIPYTGTVP